MPSASAKLKKTLGTQSKTVDKRILLSNIVGTGQWSVSALFGLWVYCDN